jgi:hypothetical protein
MANDLLDDNGCSIILQSFDDAAMELFFLQGVVIRFLSLPKSTCTSTKFYGISSWIDVVHLWQTLFFSINVLTKLGASLKFHESSRLVDPLANPI